VGGAEHAGGGREEVVVGVEHGVEETVDGRLLGCVAHGCFSCLCGLLSPVHVHTLHVTIYT